MQHIDEVRNILADTLSLGDRKHQLDENSFLLGSIPELDSMAVVNVITALEDFYNISVDDDEISAKTFETLGSLTIFVEQNCHSRTRMDSPTLCAEPFFLKVESGERFCLFYRPNLANPLGTFIFIHPFAEEMNKSRRMIAQQSKAFSENGFAVLQIDLCGCGDSSGEFNEARWEVWKQDIFHAINWIKHQTAAPINLWGLRLGGLLALDLASEAEESFQHIVLWNPIISGNTFSNSILEAESS